jgi:nucleotide-binding universal stress UspA family protein
MIDLKRILLPTDFSENSEVALKYALAFAEMTGASIHVLHVLQTAPATGWPAEIYVPPPTEFFERIEHDARERLDTWLTPEQRTKYKARLVAVSGSPFLEIVQYAKREDIDLIVIGTHGRGPVGHMLIGSVAERVVRKAPCPVLTVRHPQHEFVMP